MLNVPYTLPHSLVGSSPHFTDEETEAQAGHTTDGGVHPDPAGSGVLALIPGDPALVAECPLLPCHMAHGNPFNLLGPQSLHLPNGH